MYNLRHNSDVCIRRRLRLPIRTPPANYLSLIQRRVTVSEIIHHNMSTVRKNNQANNIVLRNT